MEMISEVIRGLHALYREPGEVEDAFVTFDEGPFFTECLEFVGKGAPLASKTGRCRARVAANFASSQVAISQVACSQVTISQIVN